MDPFIKRKVKTMAERDALLKQALDEWHKIGTFQFLVASSDQEYVEKVSACIEVEQPAIEAPRSLTSTEITKQQTDLVHLQIFGNRRTDGSNLPPVLQKVADEQEAAELAILLAPARHAEKSLDKLIEGALMRVMRKSGGDLPTSGLRIRQAGERPALMLRAAVEEDPGSDVARYLSAYVAGDETGMRKLIRELEAA
ncbi:MAG: hypothetical protein WBE13_13700 [Candidatus Acidiferrum sp.]